MSGFELVVAHYQEDLAWLKRVPREFQVTVYTKDKDLPNFGREAGTYLHHLTERYDSLAEITVFCQGKPFDHAFDFHQSLRALRDGSLRMETFHWFGHILDTEDSRGRLFQAWSKNAEGMGLDLAGFFREVFQEEVPPEMMFALGGQFAVTAETVRHRAREFYVRGLAVAKIFPEAAHCFERTWDRVFGVEGIPATLRSQGPTVYLKPIKRLNQQERDK